MLERTEASRERYEQFLSRVTESQTVWGLRNDDGWANAPSNEDGEAMVILFWSDRASAKRCATEEWKSYVPTPIALEEFVNAWLPGMARDGVFVGPNWSGQLIGLELPAEQVKNDLLGRRKS